MDPQSLPGHPLRLAVVIGLALFAVIAAIGFVIGFFPAYWGDDGSIQRGIDRGWKFALLLCAMTVLVGVLSNLIRTTKLPRADER